MRSAFPGCAAARTQLADALLVAIDGALAPPLAYLNPRRRRRELSLGRFRWDEAGKRAAEAAIG